MEITDVVIICVIGIFVVIVGYWAAQKIQTSLFLYRRKMLRIRVVEKNLQLATEQRSVFRIEIMAGKLLGTTLDGLCISSNASGFVIQLLKPTALPQEPNPSVHLFFSIVNANKKIFHHFEANILKIVRNGKFFELHFLLPKVMEQGQKRAFVRHVPASDSVLALGMWILSDMVTLPKQKTDVKKPFLTFRPNTSQNDLRIGNISAGGMRVHINERVFSGAMKTVQPGGHLLFLLVLANKNSEEKRKTVSLWLSCRVINLSHNKQDNIWQVSMSFETWADIEGSSVQDITWFPRSKDKSIPPLVSWIMHAHMEQEKFNQ